MREGGEIWGEEGREEMKVNSLDGLFDVTGRDDAVRQKRANDVTLFGKKHFFHLPWTGWGID